MSSPIDPMTKGQQEFCTWTGVFGALIAAATFIQHFIYSLPSIIAKVMNGPYLFITAAFVALAMQQLQAPRLMIVASILAFINCAVLLLSGAFSPLLIILMLYSVVITVFIYVEKIHLALRKKREAEKAEEEKWKNIL